MPNSRAPVASIKPIGQVAIFLQNIVVNIGIQQINRNAPDLHLPYLREERAPGHGYRYLDGLARGVGLQLHRLIDIVIDRIGLLLKAVRVEVLLEVTFLIENADSDQGDAQIAGALQMIAAEHAQAAGVILQALGQAKLHRKISDGRLPLQLTKLPGEPGMVGAHIFVKGTADAGVMRHEGRIARERVQALLARPTQHPFGIVSRLLPQIWIEPAKQGDGFVVPSPT